MQEKQKKGTREQTRKQRREETKKGETKRRTTITGHGGIQRQVTK